MGELSPSEAFSPDDPSPLVRGLSSQYMNSLNRAAQRHILELADETARHLHRWAAKYPLVRRVRVWPLALSVAAAAPFNNVDALVSTARISLWIFTLDDLFDEERLAPLELMRRADRYRGLAHFQETTKARDSLATALREVRDDLATYAIFPELAATWAEAFCATIDGMARENEWRAAYLQYGASALPSYKKYVEAGLSSIGGPPHVWTSLVTVGDRTTSSHLPFLQEMERHASTCIRLANDLKSYHKELQERKINALVILSDTMRRRGCAPDDAHNQAETYVRQDIARGLARLAELRAQSRTESGQPESSIADIARFVCDFYVSHDYHTMRPELD